MLRTSGFRLLFILPKSSFGEHTFPRNTHAGFVSKCTNPAYYQVEAIVVKSLQIPAWVFRGNVVSHMDDDVSAQLTR